ncbi:hypothetical protein FRB99_000686 [Tulasnella sp. 403]|nr:hypothetical protein FRB99_000686 [Tulasnella sp. 403]
MKRPGPRQGGEAPPQDDSTPLQPSPPAEPVLKKMKLEENDDAMERTENEDERALSKAERKKAKKAKKANDKALIESLPTFAFDGNELKTRTRPIAIGDLRDLILATVLGTPPPKPSWLVVRNPQNIKHFVVLNIQGITPDCLDLPIASNLPPAYPLALPTTSQSLTSLHKLFSHACPSRAHGENGQVHAALTTFLTSPVSPADRIKRQREQPKIHDPHGYILTPAEMVANNYVLPSYIEAPEQPETDAIMGQSIWNHQAPVRDSTWVETPNANLFDMEGKPPKMKIWAIDCEMVETTAGRELGRISIVDYNTSIVILDTLVKPSSFITSYLTNFSGLSEEVLKTATLTLPDLQKRLLAPGMLDFWTILVGHSLENDLAALKLAHPKVVDTSVIFQHPRGPPSKPSLRWLAQKWLGKTIQEGNDGHDPRQDATTCIELLKLKLQYGPSFGRYEQSSESIFEIISRQNKKSAYIGDGATFYASKATSRVDCENDDAVMEAVITNISKHDFIFARFQQLQQALGWRVRPDAKPPTTEDALVKLDSQIRRLHQSLPAYTALCIFTGQADPRRASELGKRKAAWDTRTRANGGTAPSEIPREEWWTTQDGRDLEDESEQARKGLVFFCITLPKITKM